jgi:hypothetical protein
MDFNNNKNSLFSGILPSETPVPQPQPQPAAAAPRPAAADEQVSALNKKIELMEKNILGQIEKKLSEPVPPPPPPPPPPSPLAPAVLQKMAEMESRLKEFQEKFLFGAAQMKNVEESKIGARREIEELLKVVREQQKYSELDRQMHDQLEKAWLRVEEMEKRLMEFYGTVVKKPAEAVSPSALAAEVYKIAEARLEERLKPLEDGLRRVSEKLDAVPAVSRGVETKVSSLAAAVDARLLAFSSEVRQLSVNAFAGKERLEGIIAEVKGGLDASVRSAFGETSGAMLRHMDAAALEDSERMNAFSKLLINHLDDHSSVVRGTAARLDELAARMKADNEAARATVEGGVREAVEKLSAGMAEGGREQLRQITSACAMSAESLSSMSAISARVSGVEEILSGVTGELRAFKRGLEGVNLESVLGVSGAMLRRSLETAARLTSELERSSGLLAAEKARIDSAARGVAENSGGEKK